MNQREKMIELLVNAKDLSIERGADYLLENGVVVLPCKVGDTVYFFDEYRGKTIRKATVHRIRAIDGERGLCFIADTKFEITDPYFRDGRTMTCNELVAIDSKFGGQPIAYLTREEAEAAIAVRKREKDGKE